MRIQVLSDLHQEFGVSEVTFGLSDVVVIAGDVNLGVKGIKWILEAIPDVPVIYVLGNHEYYKGSYPKTLHAIKAAAMGSNVHVLENKSVVIDDVTFHGTTLWTDFALQGDPKGSGSYCQEKMNDYKMIRRDPSYSKMRSVDTFMIHQRSLSWLKSSLGSSVTRKNIVVTHHAPSVKSIPEHLRNDLVSSAYASNLEDVILRYQPQYWIHGHVHTPADYTVGATRIICNPHGYRDDRCNVFDKKLIIEV
jgi:predicted phosphohydrolase